MCRKPIGELPDVFRAQTGNVLFDFFELGHGGKLAYRALGCHRPFGGRALTRRAARAELSREGREKR